MKLFYTKIGLELLIPLLLIIGFILNNIITDFNLTGLIVLLVVILISAIIFSTKYIINNNVLIVKCSFLMNKVVPINSIKSIKEITDFISAPAASIDRLLIKYNENEYIVISPKRKSAFIIALKEINPSIEIINSQN